ncbi:MAG: efflux RND transporter periplasmic adaptor subunit [Thermodesulfovibrionales bacterium]|nr:efflux RND transporter periplasmic adaptor subunit [Thermodesulfovibrionales bacterium]
MFFIFSQKRGIDVKVAPVKKETLLITVTATQTGTIKSEIEARISAQKTGRITKLLFDEGSIVDTRSVIAEIDPEEAYLNLKLSEATLQKAKHGLNEMKTSLDAMKTDVETNIAKTGAVLIEAEKRLNRAKELIKTGYITEAELDATEKEHSVAKATHEAALSGKKQIDAKLYDIKAQEAAVKEAENSVSIARLNYDYSFVKSPINGVVTDKFMELGDTVTKGIMIATVVATDSLYVEGLIDEADIARISLGKETNITMDAYQGRTFKGTVYRIAPVVTGGKQETRTFEVRIRLNEPPALKPGMSAEVEVIVDKADNVLIIPSQAIIEREGNPLVYIAKGSKAKLVPIKTGRSNWTYTEVLSGIAEGDEVILNTDAKGLADGARVKKK